MEKIDKKQKIVGVTITPGSPKLRVTTPGKATPNYYYYYKEAHPDYYYYYYYYYIIAIGVIVIVNDTSSLVNWRATPTRFCGA